MTSLIGARRSRTARHFDSGHLPIPEKAFVLCGMVLFAFYIFMDVVASLAYDGYSYRDQTISELSATGAPTRGLWLSMSVVYQLLVFAFAVGVLTVAGNRRAVRIVGWLVLAFALTNVLWWFAPMHQRAVLAAGGDTWQDTMHLVLGGASSLLFFAMIGVGAFAFGKGFRLYSFATFAVVLVAGALVGTQTGGVGEDEPTRWLGIWERIAVEGSMLWQAVFAAVLLWSGRKSSQPPA